MSFVFIRAAFSPVRKFSRWRALLAGVCLLWGGTHALAQATVPAPQVADEARRLFREAHRLTGGGNFSAPVCAQARPLLQASLEQWEKLPAAVRDDVYVRMQLARCEITQGEHAAAAAHLRQLLDAPQQPGNVLLVSEARIDMGDLYAQGLGVAKDEEKALGLYLLARPHTWPAQRHRDRAAAELAYRLNGNHPDALFHMLLERGGAPSNWLRSIEVRRANNENHHALVRLQIAAIQAAQFPATDQAEAAAMQRLLEEAGLGLLAWGDAERLPAAIVYLQRAGTPAAQAALQELEKRLPYRLKMPDGSSRGDDHAQ